MANKIEGVTDKLIACATEEFLEHGFEKASLRVIAEKANTSTTSIYVRFKGKKGLFDAIVAEAMEAFKEVYKRSMDDFKKNHSGASYTEMFECTDKSINNIMECIYQHFEAFRLLLCAANESTYSEFINEIIDYEEKETLRYIEEIGSNVIASGKVSMALIHILNTSYIMGLFEVVKHDMNKAEAIIYSNQLKSFFQVGWERIFED